ncbi:MAG: hypothetical protein IPN64_00120 [Propionivibrio sp.]|nr:hypothetical protein [Propionivibrio sp.]
MKRVIFCTGEIYYELLAARREKNIDTIAIARLEQLYRLPARSLCRRAFEVSPKPPRSSGVRKSRATRGLVLDRLASTSGPFVQQQATSVAGIRPASPPRRRVVSASTSRTQQKSADRVRSGRNRTVQMRRRRVRRSST